MCVEPLLTHAPFPHHLYFGIHSLTTLSLREHGDGDSNKSACVYDILTQSIWNSLLVWRRDLQLFVSKFWIIVHLTSEYMYVPIGWHLRAATAPA